MSDDRAGATKESDHRLVIAIDGPAAAGKTTVARALADRVGAIFLDTGLLYRAVTLAAHRAGIAPTDGAALADLTAGLELEVQPASVDDGRPCDVLLNGSDVTPLLRQSDIDRDVSAVSAHADVRANLLPIQQQLASRGKIVMVGRDITTVVVPDAGVKIYLVASLPERARRRHSELVARGSGLALADVEADLARRDEYDSSRDIAPLSQADDATVLDTDGLTIEQVVDRLAEIAETTWSGERVA